MAQKHMKKLMNDWDWNKKYKDVQVEFGRNSEQPDHRLGPNIPTRAASARRISATA